jgi:hypothetical protein
MSQRRGADLLVVSQQALTQRLGLGHRERVVGCAVERVPARERYLREQVKQAHIDVFSGWSKKHSPSFVSEIPIVEFLKILL